MTDLENETKQQLNENVEEACGGAPAPMPPENPGSPVSMNVSLNASGKDHVEDLIDMMKKVGMHDAEQVKPEMMPALPMRMDMERFRDIVDDSQDLDEWDYEPDEQYQDHNYMTKDLSGGLNREKGQYAKAQDGDNAMAVEDSDSEEMGPDGKPFDPSKLMRWKQTNMPYDQAIEKFGKENVGRGTGVTRDMKLVPDDHTAVFVPYFMGDAPDYAKSIDSMRNRGDMAYKGDDGKLYDLDGNPYKHPRSIKMADDKTESIKEQLYKALRAKY